MSKGIRELLEEIHAEVMVQRERRLDQEMEVRREWCRRMSSPTAPPEDTWSASERELFERACLEVLAAEDAS